jgi:putative spermidine/putrescine transport system permease protein
MTHRKLTPVLLLFVAVSFFMAFFIAPLAVVLLASFTQNADANAFTFSHYIQILADRYHWDVIRVTFRIAFLTTIISLILGYPLAWYLVRIVQWRSWRRVCVILLVIPLFTSNIVRSFGWIILLGRNGLINQTLVSSGLMDRPLRLLGTETGILIGLVYILLPFVVLATGNALAKVDAHLEQASKDLGGSSFATFLHVTLPLTLPGVISGSIIVFSLAVSAYVTPALLSGGRITVLSMLIFQQYSSVFDFNYGGALSIVLLVMTLCMIGLAARMGETRGAMQ